MSDSSLHFLRIDINRMPGFKTGFTLDELGLGVNIIYGPNASGKTTTVIALNAVLWPKQAPSRADVTGHFSIGDASWSTIIFGHSRQCQRNGQPHDPPPLPPVEACERYNLSLHDLLKAENESFAAAIARETAGGYDVTEAARTISTQENATRHAVKETNAYASASKSVREARGKQEELQREEDELVGLRNDRQNALEARQQIELLKQAIRYMEAKRRLQETEIRLSAFPAEMARLAETDNDSLTELESNLRQEQERLQAHEDDRNQARQALQDCDLPKDGVAVGLLPALREKGRKLDQLDEQMRTLRRNLEKAKAKVADAQLRLGKEVDDKRLQQLDMTAFGELASFARRAELLRAQQLGVGHTMRWLTPSGSTEDPENIHQGRTFLNQWLRAGEMRQAWPSWLPWLLLAMSMVIVVESVTLVAQGLWPFLLGALFGSALGVAGVILLILTLHKERSPRQDRQEEFERLDLDRPEQWTEEEVSQKLDELDRRKAVADIETEQARRRNDLEIKAQELAEQQKRMEQQRADLVQRFGVAPEDASNVNEATLYLLAENINRWQAAVNEGSAAHGEMETARYQHQQMLNEMNEALAPYNYQPAAWAEDAMRHTEDLEARNQQFVNAQIQYRNAQQNMESARKRVEKLEAEFRQFFEARGISIDDKITLQRRLDRLDEYEACKKAVETATIERQQSKTVVESHPELGELSEEELRAKLVESEEMASRFEQIVEQIGRIEERVEMAKAGSELGDALADKASAAQALRSRRERDYEAVTGGVLAAYVKQETAEQTRPAVFRRARKLFADITHGKYELLLNEGVASFRAKDTTTGIGHSLDELSSATRVQLLMAVRLAFVEEQELGVMLPLFFDETLGNSDEERATAIVQTVLEMARQGRQIFYFTAQLDEVEKWRGIASDGASVDTHFVNLAEVRQLSTLERIPLPGTPVTPQEIPRPDAMSYYEYGEALQVPGIDPTTMDIDGVHIWHVFDDVNTLYQVISNNINSWGQLRTLAELGSMNLLGIEETDYKQADASARVIQMTIQHWRVGWGKPVDRQVLLDSGQVSDTHIDATAALVSELRADGLALVKELEMGKIPRFWSSKRDNLKKYLEENGYISHAERFTHEEILLRIRHALAQDIQAGLISSARVDELVRRILAYEDAEH